MSDTPYVFDVTEADFEEKVLLASTKTPVLVDFWAPWCAPCKQLAPVLEKLVESYRGQVVLAKVNTDEQQQLAAIFGVRSLPTVLLIKDGRPLDGFLGVQPEPAIRALLEPHLGPAPDAEEAEPQQAAVQDPRVRIAELRAAIQSDPAKDELKLDLAQSLATAGEADEAQQLLDGLPANLSSGDAARKARSQILFARATGLAPPIAELAARVSAAPDDLRSRYQLGARTLLAGDAAAAFDQFLEVMRRDRKFDDDAGRKALIAAFDLVSDPDLVAATRRKMASMIF